MSGGMQQQLLWLLAVLLTLVRAGSSGPADHNAGTPPPSAAAAGPQPSEVSTLAGQLVAKYEALAEASGTSFANQLLTGGS